MVKCIGLIVLSRELGGCGGWFQKAASVLNGVCWVNVPISVSGMTAVGHEPRCNPVSFTLSVPSLHSGPELLRAR